jgi:hypothetical protein
MSCESTGKLDVENRIVKKIESENWIRQEPICATNWFGWRVKNPIGQ